MIIGVVWLRCVRRSGTTRLHHYLRLVARAPGDGRLLLARGVAYALASDFGRAAGDLARTQIQGSREPQLWKYAVEAMRITTKLLSLLST
ncbi:hypothetical protein BPIT_34920 [Candidatus Brocadia pituitae]|nr:hypothetical protein BPIT_34920 [Candidatus Brocadia pituitae]